jgi:putative hydrolase of the HAD superfamily
MLRAIYFDAVGTLIHPQPGAGEVYFNVGRRHGSNLTCEQIGRRFRVAFKKQEAVDRRRGWQTDECREQQRWRDIVAEVLDDVRDPAACFAELYEHFAQARAWFCEPGIEMILDQLRAQRYQIGLASNYDHRLHAVLPGLKPLAAIDRLLISSEVGWRKPASEFFAAICDQADAAPDQVLYVGDDRINDYQGAIAAKLRAVLVAPSTEPKTQNFAIIENITALPAWLMSQPDLRGLP